MTLWFICLALTLGVAAALLWPLLRTPEVVPARRTIEMAVFKDQLAELDRDVARAAIDEQEAAAARLEIQRRLLAADRGWQGDTLAAPSQQSTLWRVGLGLVAMVPAIALGLYAYLGSPDMAVAPPQAQTQIQSEMVRLVESLAQKLEGRPDDLEGFRLLARSAAGIGRMDLAVPAYRRAVALDQSKDLDLLGDFAETLAMSERSVVPEARRAFDAILGQRPKDPRARFYLAEAQAEIGAWDKALEQWQAILNDAPSGAEFTDVVKARIAEASGHLGKTVPKGSAVPTPSVPSNEPGPGADDVKAAAQMAPADRQNMIAGMVARLAERLQQSPDDPAGWRRLGRAYLVMGKIDESIGAYEQAVRREPKSTEGLAGLAAALRQGRPANDPRYGEVLEQLLAQDPENAEALMGLGERDLRAGRVAEAKAKWTKLLAGWPKDEPQRKSIIVRMKSLAAETKTAPADLGLVE
jgi:cytochrome c-type biogenesis protein CcmH